MSLCGAAQTAPCSLVESHLFYDQMFGWKVALERRRQNVCQSKGFDRKTRNRTNTLAYLGAAMADEGEKFHAADTWTRVGPRKG